MYEEFERLQEIGSFGLTCEGEAAIFECEYNDGYDDSAIANSDQLTLGWKLVFKVLPGTKDNGFLNNAGEIESRADYLWNFFLRRKQEGNSSFIIECPRTRKLFLAKFAEHRISYEMFATCLYSSGLTLKQRRERGTELNPDGSLIVTENPQVI